jgi:hypothetical protein
MQSIGANGLETAALARRVRQSAGTAWQRARRRDHPLWLDGAVAAGAVVLWTLGRLIARILPGYGSHASDLDFLLLVLSLLLAGWQFGWRAAALVVMGATGALLLYPMGLPVGSLVLGVFLSLLAGGVFVRVLWREEQEQMRAERDRELAERQAAQWQTNATVWSICASRPPARGAPMMPPPRSSELCL